MQLIDRFLKTQYYKLEPREALQYPPDILLGVSHEAREQLKKLEVRSVFDLALSGIFANANKLLKSMEDPTDALTRYGTAPSDIIDQTVQIEEAASLPTMDIQVLAGIGPINGPMIAEALDVVTVRDLALWPPYLAAQAIFQEAFSPEQTPGYDSESPPDLLPKSGVYPTERVFYSTIVLDEIIDDVSKLSPLENAGPIDISPSINANFGFKKPAVGAILTFSQTWFTQGVTLGQLLHSVALAPGESTRIAMIDWSRRSGVSVDESLQENEALSNTMGHNRSISEVTQAVAREAQSGFSNTSTDSFSIEAGVAAGGLFGPVMVGASVGTAYSTSNAASFSSSSGRRDLSASMSQNIMDNTQQYANSARNRRASVIKEVSQSESEKVTTRVVTNYNHMHALSVQYYEVVQLYRVVVQLSEAEKCLFIPMKLIDFRNNMLIAKYRHVLAAYALSGRIRRLLEPDPDTITLRAATVTGSIIGSTENLPPRPPTREWSSSSTTQNSQPTPPPGKPAGEFTGKWNMGQLEQISLKIGRNILDPSGVLKLPAEMQLIGLFYSTNIIVLERLEIVRRSTGSFTIPLTTGDLEFFQEPIPLSDIVSLDILNKAKTEDDHVNITLRLAYKGEMFRLHVPFYIPMKPTISNVAEFSSSQIGEGEIADHLMANQLHYSQAIWRNLDAATLALLLSPYKYSDKPVTQIIDPVPVTIAGNFAVFRIHADPVTDTSWAKWLKEHGIDHSIVKQEIVPLPSGGVFAEAVLGRYNSAEKLDMTRFWNWQDSPIPRMKLLRLRQYRPDRGVNLTIRSQETSASRSLIS